MIQNLYHRMIAPFEDAYRKNIHNQQQKAGASSRQGGVGQPPSTPVRPTIPNQTLSGSGQFPQTSPTHMSTPGVPSSPNFPQSSQQNVTTSSMQQQAFLQATSTETPIPLDVISPDMDPQALKRKAEVEETEGKRARQKTGMSNCNGQV